MQRIVGEDMPPLVSVIIPIRNEEATLGRCLESVVGQNYPSERLEVLVADGLSEDGSRCIAERFAAKHPGVQVLDNPDKITPAGLNVAIRRARGDVIVRVDGHTILESDYVRQCVRALERTEADNVGGPMRPQAEGWVAEAIALAMTSPFCVPSQVRQRRTEGFVESVYMCAFRREVFDKVGLFSEDLIRNQDYELNYRIRQAGGQIYQTPAIKSWYISRGSLQALWQQFFDYGFWKIQMITSHPRSLRPRHLTPPTFVLSLLCGVALSPFSPLVRHGLLGLCGIYSLLALSFSILLIRDDGLRYLPVLPLIFACVHVSWGLGFLFGASRSLYDGVFQSFGWRQR